MIGPRKPTEIADGTGAVCFMTHDEGDVLAARRLQAREYLIKNFIEPQHIDQESGTLTDEYDPYVESSRYFVIKFPDGEIAATSRQILFNPDKGEASFPVLASCDIYDDCRKYIESVGLENCVEISALAKDHRYSDMIATAQLYKEMWQHAVEQDGDDVLWLIAASPSLYRNLKMSFDGAVVQMGDITPYPGEEVIPAMINPRAAARMILDSLSKDGEALRRLRIGILRTYMEGLNRRYLTEDVRDDLRAIGI